MAKPVKRWAGCCAVEEHVLLRWLPAAERKARMATLRAAVYSWTDGAKDATPRPLAC